MIDAYIVDHVRTPRGRGKPGGGLHAIQPVHLAAQTLQALRDRNRLETETVEDITLGCVFGVGEQGGNLGRIAALEAGFSELVAGRHVNRYCGSGLDAVNAAAAQIMSGQAECTIGGGVECLSRVPMGSDGGPWATDPAVAFKTHFLPQGIGADLVATLHGYTRCDVDSFAAESQRRAAHAQAEGYFERSIIPVRYRNGREALAKDEFIRPETTVDSLAALSPSFASMGEKGGFDEIAKLRYPHVERIDHVHHAGNSSGIVDGAAAVLITTSQGAQRQDLRPRARIRAFATIGSEPAIMLTAPAAVTERVLTRAGMSVDDIDLFEVNEAFASVVLLFMENMGVSHEKVNVNGGSIALGHPMGATGAMLVGTALDELERRGLGTALITLCVGAGMGVATIIERV